MPGRARSALASVIGFVLVGLILLWALQFVLGTVFWVLRMALVAALIGGLLWAFLALTAPDDD
jgi:small-conductance mechanosensitive channel